MRPAIRRKSRLGRMVISRRIRRFSSLPLGRCKSTPDFCLRNTLHIGWGRELGGVSLGRSESEILTCFSSPVMKLMGIRNNEERVRYIEASPKPCEMSACFSGWSVFRQCFAAFRDLILHWRLRQRWRQTASPSQGCLFLFFFFPSFSLRFEQPKGGEEMQRKELVSGFVVSSLHEAPPSLPRKRLSPKSRRHSLICVCGLSLLGGGKCRNVSPPLLVERTLISLR